MTAVEVVETPILQLTEAAVLRVRRLMEERNLHDHALRVFVSGGGCSGLQYGMALEPNPRDADRRLDFKGVEVVVDPISATYLAGATIDYSDGLMGGGFRIENPNAIATFGCGHSFRTEGSRRAAEHGSGCTCH
ncbi:MAG: iron-sulfur cluster assembly accessory protein [Chloroflexota bacterium]